jgi:hypothetical protein
MGRACSTHGRVEICIQYFLVRKFGGGDHFRDLGIDLKDNIKVDL